MRWFLHTDEDFKECFKRAGVIFFPHRNIATILLYTPFTATLPLLLFPASVQNIPIPTVRQLRLLGS